MHPFHLILPLQFLCHAFLRLHLAGQLLQPFLAGAVDFLPVFHAFAGKEKPRVQSWPIFFEITEAHPSVLALRALFCFGQAKVGQKVIFIWVTGALHGKIPTFCCIEKAAMVLKVSLQAITA